MKNETFDTLRMLDEDKITDNHLRWEYLKYEIRRFTIPKNFVKEKRTKTF